MGYTWAETYPPPDYDFLGKFISVSDDGSVVLCPQYDDDVYVSEDSGSTWRHAKPNPDVPGYLWNVQACSWWCGGVSGPVGNVHLARPGGKLDPAGASRRERRGSNRGKRRPQCIAREQLRLRDRHRISRPVHGWGRNVECCGKPGRTNREGLHGSRPQCGRNETLGRRKLGAAVHRNRSPRHFRLRPAHHGGGRTLGQEYHYGIL